MMLAAVTVIIIIIDHHHHHPVLKNNRVSRNLRKENVPYSLLGSKFKKT